MIRLSRQIEAKTGKMHDSGVDPNRWYPVIGIFEFQYADKETGLLKDAAKYMIIADTGKIVSLYPQDGIFRIFNQNSVPRPIPASQLHEDANLQPFPNSMNPAPVGQ